MGVDMLITRTVDTTSSIQRHHMDSLPDSTLSITSTSLLNRFMTRPWGVVSKKASGRWTMVTSMPWWRRLEARRLPQASSSAAEKERAPTVQQHSLSSNQIVTWVPNPTASNTGTQTECPWRPGGPKLLMQLLLAYQGNIHWTGNEQVNILDNCYRWQKQEFRKVLLRFCFFISITATEVLLRRSPLLRFCRGDHRYWGFAEVITATEVLLRRSPLLRFCWGNCRYWSFAEVMTATELTKVLLRWSPLLRFCWGDHYYWSFAEAIRYWGFAEEMKNLHLVFSQQLFKAPTFL